MFVIIHLVKTKLRRVLTIVLFLVSTLIALWGFWPMGLETRSVQIYPADMQLPDPQGDSPSAILEERILILETPRKLRLGDPGTIRLTFASSAQSGLTPTAGSPGAQQDLQAVQFRDVYDTHFVIAQARLDLAGVDSTPAGQVSEGLFPGKPARFDWSLHPAEEGRFPGTVWLHLSFMPVDNGPESRVVLTAQLIEIPVVSLWGLSGTWARVLGSVGIVVALAVSLDELLPRFWKSLPARRQ